MTNFQKVLVVPHNETIHKWYQSQSESQCWSVGEWVFQKRGPKRPRRANVGVLESFGIFDFHFCKSMIFIFSSLQFWKALWLLAYQCWNVVLVNNRLKFLKCKFLLSKSRYSTRFSRLLISVLLGQLLSCVYQLLECFLGTNTDCNPIDKASIL